MDSVLYFPILLRSSHHCLILHRLAAPLVPTLPDSVSVHAFDVFYLRYSPPPLYFDTGQYTTASTSFLALSCTLASLVSVGSCHSVWIGRVGRFSQVYPLSSSPSRFGLSPSSPGFLPDQLPHSHIETSPSLQRATTHGPGCFLGGVPSPSQNLQRDTSLESQ